MKVIRNNFFPKILGFMGITLYPFVFICSDDKVLLKHEMIHVEQIKREGVFKFYSKYAYEYVRNLLKYKDSYKAYMEISYEKEAYERQYEK